MKKEQILKNIGLNDIASKIYLYLLNEKKATILDISRGTNIARTSIYSNIELLKKWGLIGQAIEGRKKFFYPESPNNLVNVIKIKEKLAEQAAQKLIPIFERDKNEFKIKFYQGSKGMQKIGNLMLESKTRQLLHIANKNIMNELLSSQYLKNFQEKRIQLGISIRILIDSTNITNALDNNNDYNRKIKILPNGIKIEMYMITFDDKVIFFGSKNENYIILIQNESFANSMKTIYQFLWSHSKQVKYLRDHNK